MSFQLFQQQLLIGQVYEEKAIEIAQVCGSTPPRQCVCTYSEETYQLTTWLHADCADLTAFSQAQNAYKAYCRGGYNGED